MGTSSDVILEATLEKGREAKCTNKRYHLPVILKWIVLSVFGVLFAIPFWWMIDTALLSNQHVFDYPPDLWPRVPEWSNFLKALQQTNFLRYIFNSIAVSTGIVSGQLITASLAAYAIARIPFRGKKVAYGLILSTLMIPAQITFIPMFLMMKQVNWIDSYQALIVPFIGSAFATFWLIQAFRQVPQIILDAAQIDGASHFWILWRIVLPLSKSALLSVAFLNFVFHYNDLFWPLIVTQSDAMRTVPVGLSYLVANDGSGTAWNVLMASSILATIPALLLFVAGQRFLVQSVAHNGMKD
jgi:ABC-type glycerol-3-phosphate transport system permease component